MCRVVNTAETDDGTGGVHWLACAEEGGRRYFNDPLGEAGRIGAQHRQPAALAARVVLLEPEVAAADQAAVAA